MKEVYPGIFMLTEKLSKPWLRPSANLYVITGGNGLIYDSGYGTRQAIEIFMQGYAEIKEHCRKNNIPCNITRILISHTHPDHFSGLKVLRKKLGLSIMLTEKMAFNISTKKVYATVNAYNSYFLYRQVSKRIMSVVINTVFRVFLRRMFGIQFINDPDVIIKDTCAIEINDEQWRIFPSPGHCDDHITLYNPKTGVLFSGDNVLSHTTTWLGPPRSDLTAYTRSLEYMLTLPKLELILGAHEKVIASPVDRIKLILRWRKNRFEDVHRVITEGGEAGVAPDQIVAKLYPYRGQNFRYIVIGWIELTVRYLLEHGYIGIKTVHHGTRFVAKKPLDFAVIGPSFTEKEYKTSKVEKKLSKS